MRFLITLATLSAVLGYLAIASVDGTPAEAAQGADPCSSTDIDVRANADMVVLKENANVDRVVRQHERRYNFNACFVYRHALKGYAAHIDPALFPAIEAEPDVLFVDREDEPSSAPRRGPPQPEQPAQVPTTAIRRVDADQSSTISGDGRGKVKINVAVLDGGIQLDHPDLNVAGGFNCLPGRDGDFADRDGHGTLVGGFIGALDNEIGRVGVAPGARLYGVRVLDATGTGSTAEILCGLDWVASTRLDDAHRNDIAVANMSFGSPFEDDDSCGVKVKDAEHYAICGIASLGVVPVAAAGNDTIDFGGVVPATYSEVLAATAIADRDGQPGGLGGNFDDCFPGEIDDTAASFSNFATLPADQAHVVAAPGVCVGSTYIGSQYATSSGTSFATPLVAGTVALCIASGPCAGLTPAQVIDKIVADATAYNVAHPEYGFDGDPLRPREGKYYGYLINASLY